MKRYKNIFVFGGSGFVGSAVLGLLKAGGYRTAVLVLAPAEAERLESSGFATYRGDITAPGDLDNAFRKFQPDAVVHLVGIIKEIPPRITFPRIHVEGTAHVVEAARRAGVRKLIYISALGARADGSTPYFRTKALAERTVKESHLVYTILRPSPMFGKRAGFTGELVRQIQRLPFAPVIGGGTYPLQTVAVSVTAHCIRQALELPPSDGKTYDVVGPEVLTLEEITRRLLRKLRLQKPILHVPLWLLRAALILERLGVPPPLTKDQLTMVLEGSVGDKGPMERDLRPPVIPFDPEGDYPLF